MVIDTHNILTVLIMSHSQLPEHPMLSLSSVDLGKLNTISLSKSYTQSLTIYSEANKTEQPSLGALTM